MLRRLIPPFPSTPAGMLDALADGRAADLLALYLPGVRSRPRPVRQDAARRVLVPAVASVAALALAGPGGPRWGFSPATATLLVDAEGREVPVRAWAAEAVVDPEGAAGLQRTLVAAGGDLSRTAPPPAANAGRGGTVPR